MPKHVAIIPDGNRRWARKKGLKPWKGHEKGAQSIEEITRKALDMGIENLTFWGSSQDNLQKRPLTERKALLKIYEEYFQKLIDSEEIYENEARIRLIGRWAQQFPQKLTRILKNGIKKTQRHSKHFLNFLLAYNGDDDMFQAVKSIGQKIKRGEIGSVNKTAIKKHLLSAELPDVDLVIRTGVQGDPHNSVGFLMWQTQDSQYYYSDKMLPDFGAEDFETAIKDYVKRARRKGA